MPFGNARKRVKGLTAKPARSVEAAIRAVAAKGSKSAHQPLVFSKG